MDSAYCHVYCIRRCTAPVQVSSMCTCTVGISVVEYLTCTVYCIALYKNCTKGECILAENRQCKMYSRTEYDDIGGLFLPTIQPPLCMVAVDS